MSGCQPIVVLASERRSRRVAGVQRQYVVAELFPSLTDMEDEDDVLSSAGGTRIVAACEDTRSHLCT